MFESQPSRRLFVQSMALAIPALTVGRVGATTRQPYSVISGRKNPGTTWEMHPSPQSAGFTNDLAAFSEILFGSPTSSLMIVRGGKIAYSYGDIGEISWLASARKSVLSMLYGRYVADGTIKLDATIDELGIDDLGGLLPIEKTATVRNLLTASSGVYHPAANPGGEDLSAIRGTVKPGSRFVYNNWDFNAAGAIFEKLTGTSIFSALSRDLAGPLGMEDFALSRQRMLGYSPARSRYKAYHMFLSGRDMARLGVLMLNGGRWDGREIVPEAWVTTSTSTHVNAESIPGNHRQGYGYLWWTPTASGKDRNWLGSFAAEGNYGQFIVCLPAADMVVVHRRAVPDEFAIARNTGLTQASPVGGQADIFLLVDMILSSLKA